MSKLVKKMIASELSDRYSGLDSALLVEYVGVDGLTNTEFRRTLRAKSVNFEIVKNSLFKRAIADTQLAPLADRLTGPTAVVTGGETLIDAAKVVEEWTGKIKGLRFKVAVLEGELIDERAVEGLHKMPTKADLQARIVSIALSPGGNLVAAALSGGSNIAGCLKTLIEKLEDGEEIKKAG